MNTTEMEQQVRDMSAAQRQAAWLVAGKTTWAGSNTLATLIAKVARENGETLNNVSRK